MLGLPGGDTIGGELREDSVGEEEDATMVLEEIKGMVIARSCVFRKKSRALEIV
jgi:hypothetical protein